MSDKNPTLCSFCGKADSEVEFIIVGPDIYICNECVDLCVEIISEERLRKEAQKHMPILADDWDLVCLMQE